MFRLRVRADALEPVHVKQPAHAIAGQVFARGSNPQRMTARVPGEPRCKAPVGFLFGQLGFALDGTARSALAAGEDDDAGPGESRRRDLGTQQPS